MKLIKLTNYSKIMIFGIVSFFCVLLTSSNATAQYDAYRRPANIIVPNWAPSYNNPANVHYYYLPDLEVYFDVWANEFVYLENGRWLFSPNLPPYFGNIDLNTAYVVMLDGNVHEPWRHHDIYLSHYPRYYYHAMPNIRDRDGLRGYNENGRSTVYMDRDRRMEEHRDVPVVVPSNREPQRVEYRGATVGRPVTVQPYMREPHDRRYRDDRRDDIRRDGDRH